MKPRDPAARLLGPPRWRPAVRDLMAITALVALGCVGASRLDGLGQVHHVRIISTPGGFERDGSDSCDELHPIHRWLTPVVYGGIGVGAWSLIHLYAPRRLDLVLVALLAVLLLA